MDILIFNELKRRGIITSPFLKATDVKDFEELYSKGYITSVWAKSAYNEIIKSLNIEETPTPAEVKEPTSTTPEPKKVEEPAANPVETLDEKTEEKEIIVDEGDAEKTDNNESESEATPTTKTKASKK